MGTRDFGISRTVMTRRSPELCCCIHCDCLCLENPSDQLSDSVDSQSNWARLLQHLLQSCFANTMDTEEPQGASSG